MEGETLTDRKKRGGGRSKYSKFNKEALRRLDDRSAGRSQELEPFQSYNQGHPITSRRQQPRSGNCKLKNVFLLFKIFVFLTLAVIVIVILSQCGNADNERDALRSFGDIVLCNLTNTMFDAVRSLFNVSLFQLKLIISMVLLFLILVLRGLFTWRRYKQELAWAYDDMHHELRMAQGQVQISDQRMMKMFSFYQTHHTKTQTHTTTQVQTVTNTPPLPAPPVPKRIENEPKYDKVPQRPVDITELH